MVCGLPWWLSGKIRLPMPEWWLGRSPGGGNGYPLQYSFLGNPKDRGAWQATVRGVATELDRLSEWTTATNFSVISAVSLLCCVWLLTLLGFLFCSGLLPQLSFFFFFKLDFLGFATDLDRGCAQTPWANKFSALHLWFCVWVGDHIQSSTWSQVGLSFSSHWELLVQFPCQPCRCESFLRPSFLGPARYIAGWSAQSGLQSQTHRIVNLVCSLLNLLCGMSFHPLPPIKSV